MFRVTRRCVSATTRYCIGSNNQGLPLYVIPGSRYGAPPECFDLHGGQTHVDGTLIMNQFIGGAGQDGTVGAIDTDATGRKSTMIFVLER